MVVMAGLAASRREPEGPGIAGDTTAADQAFGAIASAARRVEVLAESGSGFLFGQAIQQLTEATAAAEDLARWKIAAEAVGEMAARRDGFLRLIR